MIQDQDPTPSNVEEEERNMKCKYHFVHRLFGIYATFEGSFFFFDGSFKWFPFRFQRNQFI